MSAPTDTAASTGRNKLAPVGRLPSTGVATSDAAPGHASQNTLSPAVVKVGGGYSSQAHQRFGDQRPKLLDELDEMRAA